VTVKAEHGLTLLGRIIHTLKMNVCKTNQSSELPLSLILTTLVVVCAAVVLRPQISYSNNICEPGDVIGVIVPGILGGRNENAPPLNAIHPDRAFPASLGFPIPVRDDGTISLPLLAAIHVDGKSHREVQRIVTGAYTEFLGGKQRSETSPFAIGSVEIKKFPLREHWNEKTWDRIRFQESFLEKLLQLVCPVFTDLNDMR